MNKKYSLYFGNSKAQAEKQKQDDTIALLDKEYGDGSKDRLGAVPFSRKIGQMISEETCYCEGHLFEMISEKMSDIMQKKLIKKILLIF